MTYNLVYAYNNAGQLTSLTYPSGRIVTQDYDAIGRTNSIVSGATTYLSGLSFNAAGQPLSFNYGNGVAATFSYNQRLQLASLRYVNGSTDLLNLAYEYGTGQQQSNNNGQIRKVKYYTSPGVEDQTKSQNYEYDAWSRLKKAYTTNLTAPNTWRLEWDYDRFGNRKNQNLTGGSASVTAPQLTISETTNRIITAGYAHDAAGNMTNDSIHVYTYDAENRIKTVDSTAATYTYSGALRVKKVQGGTTTVYIFSGTKVIAEYVNGALSKEYVYSGSTLLATHEGATLKYHHPDHLSTRVETDSAGAVARTFGQFPFGEVWYETGTASKWKFTSYERDSESGLDNAMFRYDSSRLGRFTSPDPLAGLTAAPQSMNRYTYAANDPVNLVDPLGLVTGPQPPPVSPPPPTPFDNGRGPFECGYMGLPVNCDGPARPMNAELDVGKKGGERPTNVSKTGKKQDQILEALNDLAARLLKDADCLRFLGGAKGVEAFLEDYPSLIGHGDFRDDSITAQSRVGTINGEVYATVINNEGSFFRDRGVAPNPGMSTPIRGGGPAAQRYVLLHEIAHGFDQFTGFLPDVGNDDALRENNRRLEENCAKTLGLK